ncbi:hypothetical protein WJ971_16325 [Achromobacter xylosoxidans]
MDSNTIRIGLMLIILVWSVISAITYMARRSGNKGALRELKQEGQPLRRLSAQEQALVQPFLVRPAKPTQSVALLNDGVFRCAAPSCATGWNRATARPPCTTPWAASTWCCLMTPATICARTTRPKS